MSFYATNKTRGNRRLWKCRECGKQIYTPEDASNYKCSCYGSRVARKPREDGDREDHRTTFYFACDYRGELLRHGECDWCPLRGVQMPIHACALHGECVPRQAERYGVQGDCLICEDCTGR